MKKSKLLVFAFAAIFCAAVVFTSIEVVTYAADTVDVVTEADIARQPENTTPTKDWVFYTRNAATGVFRTGPDTPPEGSGSFEITTPTGNDKGTLFNFEHIDTELDNITAIGYSTYRSSGQLQQVAALNIQV